MKKLPVIVFIALAVPCLAFGQATPQKTDTEKQKEAIKAVFEANKAAYFNRDFVGMGETWVKAPSTQKIWISDKGQTKIVGWENINASERRETEDNSWDRKLVTATFSNYQIDVMDGSAWVVCDTNWKGAGRNGPMKLKQSRIAVLKKIGGKWRFALVAIYRIPEEQPSLWLD